MRWLIALCREAAVTWWRELPPLVRSRQFLYTTLMLVCVGLLVAFGQVVRGGAQGGPAAAYALSGMPLTSVAPAPA
jgi:hypothetical protein